MPWLMFSWSCPQPTPIGTMHSEVQVQPPNRGDKAQPHTKHQVSSGTALARARDRGHAQLGLLLHRPTEPSGASGWRQGLGHHFLPSAVCGTASSLQVWVCGYQGDQGSDPGARWPGRSERKQPWEAVALWGSARPGLWLASCRV